MSRRSPMNMIIHTNDLFRSEVKRDASEGKGHKRGWGEIPDSSVFHEILIMTPVLITNVKIGPKASTGRKFNFGFTWTEEKDHSKCNMVLSTCDVTYYVDEIDYEVIDVTELSKLRRKTVTDLKQELLKSLEKID